MIFPKEYIFVFIITYADLAMASEASAKFIKNYFSYKNINSVNLISCSRKESYHLINYLNKNTSLLTMHKYTAVRYTTNQWFYNSMKNEEPQRIGIYVNLNCEFSKRILKENFLPKYNAGTYSWIFWSESYDQGIKKIEKLKIQWNSDIFLAVPGIRMYKMHRIQHNTELSIPIYASWNETTEFKMFQVDDINDLKGYLIRGYISVNNAENDTVALKTILTERYVTDQSEILPKLSFILHNFLADVYNFRWDLNLSLNNQHNINILHHNENEGQFLALQSGLIDVGLNLNQLTTSKINIVDVIPSISKFRQGFVFRHPKMFTEPTDLLKPFSNKVWLGLIMILFLCTIGLRFISLFATKNEENNSPSLSLNLIVSIGILCQQGLPSSSKKTSKRIIHISLLLLSSLAFGFYNAAIVILLLSPTQQSINSVDLLIKKRFELGAEDLPYNRYYLGTDYDTRAQMVYNLKLKGKTPEKDKFYKLSDGVEMLENRRFAFFAHLPNIYNMIEHFKPADVCSLTEVHIYKPFDLSAFVRKSLPYKELFIRGLLLLRETGIVSRENNYWLTNKPYCTGARESIVVNMKSLFLAYAVYIAGLLSSLLLLLLELLLKYKKLL